MNGGFPAKIPSPDAMYVDDSDLVWLSDFRANALVRFDPAHQRFETFRMRSPGANVRQLLGRESEVWGAQSGGDRLVVAKLR